MIAKWNYFMLSSIIANLPSTTSSGVELGARSWFLCRDGYEERYMNQQYCSEENYLSGCRRIPQHYCPWELRSSALFTTSLHYLRYGGKRKPIKGIPKTHPNTFWRWSQFDRGSYLRGLDRATDQLGYTVKPWYQHIRYKHTLFKCLGFRALFFPY